MATQVRNPQLAYNNDIGYQDWTSPENVYSDDSNYAFSYNQTDELKAQNFGFSIPANATITSIEVNVKGFSEYGTYDNNVRIKVLKNGSATDSGQISMLPNITYEESEASAGGSGLWGTTWNPSDINSQYFGCSVQSSGYDNYLSVNHIQMIVSYTVPATNTAGFMTYFLSQL